MAKAIFCITGCAMSASDPGQIELGGHVSLDENLSSPPEAETPNGFPLNMKVSHGSAAAALVLAVRNRIIAVTQTFGGPVLSLNDIQVFGGPV
jgi:hypothetical protein